MSIGISTKISRMRANASFTPLLVESDKVEFKETWTEDAMSDLAAFANTRGGTLYLGVQDSGDVLGCDVSDDAQQRIGSKIRNILQIGAEIRVAEGRILVIDVEKSRAPVLLGGSYWTRMGTTSIKATPEQWVEMVMKQTGKSWDAQPAHGVTNTEAIDAAAVSAYVRRGKTHAEPRLPEDLSENTPPETVLSSLDLYTDAKLTNAAVFLFGKTPQRNFRNAIIRIARFRGTGVDDFSEHVPIVGTLFDQIDSAVRVLEEYVPIKMIMPGTPGNLQDTLQRRELRDYPVSVLREAVTNAAIHRDYASSDDIQIRVLDDRFEIWNPGGLVPGLKVEDLYKNPHDSRRRNPLLAGTAFFIHVIERWGTGTTRMLKACRDANLPDPEFSERSGGFLTVLRKDLWTTEKIETLGLNERQRQAMVELRANGFLSVAIYRKVTGASERTASRELGELEQWGVVERAGGGRTTHYVFRRP